MFIVRSNWILIEGICADCQWITNGALEDKSALKLNVEGLGRVISFKGTSGKCGSKSKMGYNWMKIHTLYLISLWYYICNLASKVCKTLSPVIRLFLHHALVHTLDNEIFRYYLLSGVLLITTQQIDFFLLLSGH